MNRLAVIILAVMGLFVGGCVIAAKMGRPTKAEQKVKPEFALAQHETGKFLIVVRGQKKSQETERLSYNIYHATKTILLNRKLVASDNLVDFQYYLDFKNSVHNFNELSLEEIGKTLLADTILEITISDYKLSKISGTGIYEGSIRVGAKLYDVNEHRVIWPEDGFDKLVSLGFDVETNGYEAAIKRLATKSGHCVTRYLYDCSLLGFKVFEENTDSQW